MELIVYHVAGLVKRVAQKSKTPSFPRKYTIFSLVFAPLFDVDTSGVRHYVPRAVRDFLMKAQPELTAIERDKLAINPDFDFKHDIAARPLDSIPPNVLALFKWTGIYQQLQRGFFMMRIRIPGGRLTADQLDRIAALGDQYAQGELCLTTRQTFQFHWLRKDDLWKVLEGVAEVGLDTKNACGDVVRNVVTCPLQGVCPHEVQDVRAMLTTLANDPELKDQQRNLPRKHKIAVNGCGRACGLTLMNCQGWFPVSRPTPAGGEALGWRWYAGGGLGARPHMAKCIYAWVPENMVLPVARACVEVFRRLGDRRVRANARLKIVVAQLGAAGFADEVEKVLAERGFPRLGKTGEPTFQCLEKLERPTGPLEIAPPFLTGQPVLPQRQAGFNTVRVLIPRAEISCAQARKLAGWARAFGDGTLMLTARQNLQFPFVPDASVAPLQAQLRAASFELEGFEQAPDIVACVGTTVCNLAVADTPNACRRLREALGADRALWEAVGPLRIHLNGCPNSCAQHWIADLGLRGMRRRTETGSEEGFQICVGGDQAGAGHIAQPICETSSSALVPTVRRVLELYLTKRISAQETFGAFARRVGAAQLAAWLGAPALPAEPVNETNQQLRATFNRAVAEAE
jgi:sulfite reductase beta subunit-like hemoprotein